MLRINHLLAFLAILAYAQDIQAQDSENINLKLHWNPEIYGQYNDCWGFTDSDGSEYGIAGSWAHIHFFDMTDMDNITEVERLTLGDTSRWRDFKTYTHPTLGSYAYGIVENNSTSKGLAVMDLSDITDTVEYNFIDTEFKGAHNLFVDEQNAKLYVVGSNTRSNGIILYDLNTNPSTPSLIAEIRLDTFTDGPSGGYVHDVYVRDDTAYCSHGNPGYWVWDFSGVTSSSTAPVLLGGIDPSASGYNHSSWLTDDGDYSFWCEETAGRKIHVADVSDLSAISLELQFSTPLIPEDEANMYAHNPFIRDTLLYISYYEDGVQIYNISDPLDPERVGYYDTEPNNTDYNGTRNNWGVYPYFSGNKIIATDTRNGVFFLEFDPVAAFLPVELISWNGYLDHNAAKLSWETIHEVNSDYYEIEYSQNNAAFVSLGSVESKKNTTEVSSYSFTHTNLTKGKNYYRLKMVDQDESFTYSNLIDINYLLGDNAWFIYPNPSNGSLQVDLPLTDSDLDKADFTFYDIQGKASLQGKTLATDQNTVQIMHNLSAGIYTLEIRLPDGQYHRDQIAVY